MQEEVFDADLKKIALLGEANFELSIFVNKQNCRPVVRDGKASRHIRNMIACSKTNSSVSIMLGWRN